MHGHFEDLVLLPVLQLADTSRSGSIRNTKTVVEWHCLIRGGLVVTTFDVFITPEERDGLGMRRHISGQRVEYRRRRRTR